jgi:3-hydroxybutyrate dehydrogenase
MRARTALVTGSTSGIGLSIARALAASGCNVVLTGFGERAAIEALMAELETRYQVGVAYVAADLADPAEIRALADAATRTFGTVHILVNNAGVQHIAELENFPQERWDQILAVNLSAAFHTTKALIPAMKQVGWGRIINISSAHGLVASPGKCAYVTAKHGLIGLTKATALETGQYGITANAVCPGYTRTPLALKQLQDRAAHSGRDLHEEERRMLTEKQAIPLFTEPGQVAELTVFLCSEGASTITGAALSIDGGWVAQ